MKTYVLVGAVALFILALAAVPAGAATDKVTAYGTVIDERGRPVPGVNVTLIDDTIVNGNFHVLGSAISDANGNFRFSNMPLAGSPYLKITLSFIDNGTKYMNRESDMRWYDGSAGLIEFNKNDTKLNYYPVSDHGYAWGVVLDAPANGRPLAGTVYLANNTTTLMADAASNGYYEIMASPGDYEIYAVYGAGSSWAISNRTKITITPSYSLHESAPQNLIADVVTQTQPATPVPTGNAFTACGMVTDAQGNPVEGATVSLIDDSFRIIAATTTDAQGNFRFTSVPLAGSQYVKAGVSYAKAGHTYNSSLENVRWLDISSGTVSFDPMDTRLYNYPPGNRGYVWGVVLDNITSGRAMDSTVYLENRTMSLSAGTSVGSMGSFNFEVSPGDYEIYAIHGEGSDRLVSRHVKIHVYPSSDPMLSAPINLIVDRPEPGQPVAIIPMATALALGIVLIVAGWALFGRKR